MSPRDPADSPSRRAARIGGIALALALFTAAMWLAWLGWDDEYYEVDGVAQGPYRAWQVLGCGLSIVVAAVLAQLWARGPVAVFALAAAAAIGFAVPWTVHAAATDDSGLFVVGLLFLLMGAGTGLVILLGITEAIATALRTRRAGP